MINPLMQELVDKCKITPSEAQLLTDIGKVISSTASKCVDKNIISEDNVMSYLEIASDMSIGYVFSLREKRTK